MDTPRQARDPSLSQDQKQHQSRAPAEASHQNDLPFLSSSLPSGIHISPFNLSVGENGQPAASSTFDNILSSPSVLGTPLDQTGSIFPTGCAENDQLPFSIAIQDNESSIQPSQNADILGTVAVNQLSQPFQTIQLHSPIQNGCQPRHVNHLAIQSGFQTGNSTAYHEKVQTETSLDEIGLVGSVLTTSCPPLQGRSSNVQNSPQAAIMTDLLSSLGTNSGRQETHCDQAQCPSSSRVAGSAILDINRPHFSVPNPFEGNRFSESGDTNVLRLPYIELPQQNPVADGFPVINQTQNVMQQPQISRSHYLSRPGQIYERVSRQTQLPVSSAALHPFASAGLNQMTDGQSITGNLPPFSHSTSTHQFLPVQPATSPAPATQDTAQTSANVESRNRDCDVCGKTFKSKKDKQRHVARMHVLKARHPCPDPSCNQSFAEAHKLKRHFRTVHLKSRPFKCPSCDAAFGERGNMAQHYRKAHGGESSKAKRVKKS